MIYSIDRPVPGLSLLWAYPVRRGVLTHNYACHIG